MSQDNHVNKIDSAIADWSLVLETRMELKDRSGNDALFEIKTTEGRTTISIYHCKLEGGGLHFDIDVPVKVVDQYLLGMSNRVNHFLDIYCTKQNESDKCATPEVDHPF